MEDIVEKLKDLVVQATKEHSHFYVKDCALRAIAEIEYLRGTLSTYRNIDTTVSGSVYWLSKNGLEEKK